MAEIVPPKILLNLLLMLTSLSTQSNYCEVRWREAPVPQRATSGKGNQRASEVKKSRTTQQTVWWTLNDKMDSGKLSSDYYNINHIKLATIAGSALNIVPFLICWASSWFQLVVQPWDLSTSPAWEMLSHCPEVPCVRLPGRGPSFLLSQPLSSYQPLIPRWAVNSFCRISSLPVSTPVTASSSPGCHYQPGLAL